MFSAGLAAQSDKSGAKKLRLLIERVTRLSIPSSNWESLLRVAYPSGE
jgi:hypothetical protein